MPEIRINVNAVIIATAFSSDDDMRLRLYRTVSVESLGWAKNLSPARGGDMLPEAV